MDFIEANFGGHKHDLYAEEQLGAVPPHRSTTSQMSDPPPPREMRVKSGYTGHVPHGRDYIGGSYKNHDNRGTATKYAVPVIHVNRNTGKYPIKVEPHAVKPSKFLYHDPFNAKRAGDKQHEYGTMTTAPVPMRVEKVLAGDGTDMDDEANRASAFDMDGTGQWVMAGYTGHVPKGREVYGTSYYGPPEGPSYHGPYYTSDKYAQPMGANREALSP